MSRTNRRNAIQPDNRGMTLVELIISFMLLSMFMVVATMVISATMNIYYQARSVSYGIQVSDIIHSKIASELSGAINGDITSDDFVDSSGQKANGAMLIAENRIEFTDGTGSHVNLGLVEINGKQYFAVHYYEVPSADGTGIVYEAVDWTFDKAAYMGYFVKELKFSRPMGDYDYNVIKVELTITHPEYGDYTTTEYVECYNFDDTVAPNRVVEAQLRE